MKENTEIRIFFTMMVFRYGVRVTTEECMTAVFVMSVQSIVGVIIQASKEFYSISFSTFNQV